MNKYRFVIDLRIDAVDDTTAKENAALVMAGVRQRLGVACAKLEGISLQKLHTNNLIEKTIFAEDGHV